MVTPRYGETSFLQLLLRNIQYVLKLIEKMGGTIRDMDVAGFLRVKDTNGRWECDVILPSFM